MSIRVTRRLLAAALDGSLSRAEFRVDSYFGLATPTDVPGVDPLLLEPIKTWKDPSAFAATAQRLVDMFEENFARFHAHVDPEVRAAAPRRVAMAD